MEEIKETFDNEMIEDELDITDDFSNENENTEDEPVVEEVPIPEPDGYIYFGEDKSAKMQLIENYICRIPFDQWREFCTLTLGKDWDIVEGEFTDLRLTDEYISEKFEIKRAEMLAENTQKAKQAVENGYVSFKDAQFETNAQTVGDLTATMLMLQAQISHSEALAEESQNQTDSSPAVQNDNISYIWLSKDDKAVELTLEDFITLGNLIAEYKNTIWSHKYLSFKTAIENAQTIEELDEIEINYGNFDV